MSNYRFDIYQFGEKINEISTDSYEKARKIFYDYYVQFEYACVTFLNGEEMKFIKAYQHFNTADMRRSYMPDAKRMIMGSETYAYL